MGRVGGAVHGVYEYAFWVSVGAKYSVSPRPTAAANENTPSVVFYPRTLEVSILLFVVSVDIILLLRA